MTQIGFVVPSDSSGADKTGMSRGGGANSQYMITTGAYGHAFELILSRLEEHGSTKDTLTYKSFDGETNGTFSAVTESGSGADMKTAYQSLLLNMQANGEASDTAVKQLNDAFDKLGVQSNDGEVDAAVSGGGMLVEAGGPFYFNGISSYENKIVDGIINGVFAQLVHDSTA
ncbi:MULTISPECIES: hypothetical protein [unclassified Bradyrhizobium]|uniref:hypothetical protein n=1 Tax=unclassified Bradyrhizobium TaxID=2631580 RepID=UPI00230622AE|nr:MULTISPECIES: hypothetical protein [unclassified Bradyrhizobium]MDA9451273.1 hypothetical protein [Bradyrhizobium sp. CCBAU 21360]MDA9457653.1 hypothetical protein [Bradyrhizobium sp. CCBAU 21359]